MQKGYCSPAWAMLDLKKISLYRTQSKWVSIRCADKYYFKKQWKSGTASLNYGIFLLFCFAFLRLGFFGHVSMQLGSILCNLNKFKKITRRVVSGQERFWRFLELFPDESCAREGETGVHCSVIPCPWCITFLSTCPVSQSRLWLTWQIWNN